MTRVTYAGYHLSQIEGSLVVHVSGNGIDDRRVIGYKLKDNMPDSDKRAIIIAAGRQGADDDDI
jgi:hypothetical protein